MAWNKNESGNPEGSANRTTDVAVIARRYARKAIKTLADIMKDPTVSAQARIMAAKELLARGDKNLVTTLTDEQLDVMAKAIAERRTRVATASAVAAAPAVPKNN
jgi:hypothetical protein